MFKFRGWSDNIGDVLFDDRDGGVGVFGPVADAFDLVKVKFLEIFESTEDEFEVVIFEDESFIEEVVYDVIVNPFGGFSFKDIFEDFFAVFFKL